MKFLKFIFFQFRLQWHIAYIQLENSKIFFTTVLKIIYHITEYGWVIVGWNVNRDWKFWLEARLVKARETLASMDRLKLCIDIHVTFNVNRLIKPNLKKYLNNAIFKPWKKAKLKKSQKLIKGQILGKI